MEVLSIVGAAVIGWVLFRAVSFVVRLLLTPATNWSKYDAGKDGWAVVTGSTDGIGKEFALQLAKKGLNIVLVARNADKLQSVQQAIVKEAGVKVECVELDFSAPALNVDKVLKCVKDRKVTVLVNNVGVSHDHPEYFTETSETTVDNIVTVNVLNTLRLTRAILPAMVERRNGLVLNLGSFSGETPIPLLQTYSASKAFLKAWSQALAAEVAAQGVEVQLLNTYYVVSNMSKKKRPSAMVPAPTTYVKAAMRTAGQGDFVTPYWTHAILYEMMQLVPTWMMRMTNLSMMRAIRQAALKKAKRT